ncbi:hypothetical protein Bca101_004391 [Brassica carinata]
MKRNLWLIALFLVLSSVISSYAVSTQSYQIRKLLIIGTPPTVYGHFVSSGALARRDEAGVILGALGLLLVADCARIWVRSGIRDPPELRRVAAFIVLAPSSRSNRFLLSACSKLWDLFYRRPPPVVSRGESQPPPLKLLGATSVSVRLNVPFSYSPAYEVF